MRLAFIKPVMDGEIVFRLSAEEVRRSNGVMVGMGHLLLPAHIGLGEHNRRVLLISNLASIEIDYDRAVKFKFSGVEPPHDRSYRVIDHLCTVQSFSLEAIVVDPLTVSRLN